MPDEIAVPDKVEDPLSDLRGFMFGTTDEIQSLREKGAEVKPEKEPEVETPEVKPEVKPEVVKKSKVVKPEEAVEQPEPEPEPTKPKPPKKLTTEELIRLNADASREAVVAGVREAVEQTTRRATPEPEQPTLFAANKVKLPSHIRKNIEAIRVLEETRPGEFKDLESKVAKFYAEDTGDLAKYKRRWEKDHPSDEFDIEADEHRSWMDENEPYIAEDDLDGAKEEHLRRRLRQEVQSEMEPMRRRFAEREAEEQAAPAISQVVSGSLKDMIAAVNPDLKGLSDEELGDSLHQKDPVAAHVLVRTAPSYVPLISETIRIFAGKPYDPNNKVHAAIDQYAGGLERSFSAMPADQSAISTNTGVLKFATRSQLARMKPEERGRYWTVDREVIVQALRRDWSEATAQSYKEYKTLLKTLSGNGAPVANNGQAPKAVVPAKVEEPIEEPEVPLRSPAVRSSSPAPPPVPADDPSLRKPGQTFFERAGW